MLSGYLLHLAHHFLLPAVIVFPRLLCPLSWHFANVGNHRVLLREGDEMACIVWKCLSEEASDGIKIMF